MNIFVSPEWLARTAPEFDWHELPQHEAITPNGSKDCLCRIDQACQLHPAATEAVMFALSNSLANCANSQSIAVIEPGRPNWTGFNDRKPRPWRLTAKPSTQSATLQE